MRSRTLAALAAGTILAAPAAAQADVFNGRIAFSSFRSSPGETHGRHLQHQPRRDGPAPPDDQNTTEDDAQSDWAPDGRDIAYRIRKPGQTSNFEVSLHAGRGQGHRAAHVVARTARPRASRRGGRTAAASSSGAAAPGASEPVDDGRSTARTRRWCRTIRPATSSIRASRPTARRFLFASVKSPTGDTDRAIETQAVTGGPARPCSTTRARSTPRPPGRRTGRGSRSSPTRDVFGINPSDDAEIWVMDADGSEPAA